MTPTSCWLVGHQVHRPFAFLLGEKLDGHILGLDSGAVTAKAQVAWADGTVTDELLEDLAPGARPPVQPQPWWRRLMRRAPAA